MKHFSTGFLVHQSAYAKKIFKCFYIDKSHLLSLSMVILSLDMKKDEKGEESLIPKVLYLCYLCTYVSCKLYSPRY